LDARVWKELNEWVPHGRNEVYSKNKHHMSLTL
jgi:hypothetical protein